MEMNLEGSNSAETFPPGVGGVRLHRGKICEVSGLSSGQLFFALHCFLVWARVVMLVNNFAMFELCSAFSSPF
jgi:hypothetical protein